MVIENNSNNNAVKALAKSTDITILINGRTKIFASDSNKGPDSRASFPQGRAGLIKVC